MTVSDNKILSPDILEKAIIAGCIYTPAFLEEAMPVLGSDDFQEPQNKVAWEVLTNMRSKGEVIDVASVIDPFQQSGLPPDFSTSLGAVWTDTFDTPYARTQKINQLTSLSDRIYGCKKLNDIVLQSKTGNVADGVQLACKLKELADDLCERHTIVSSGYVGDTLSADIDDLAKNNKGSIQFGLADIDRYLGGMNPGQYIIIAARPATGKSALVIQPFIDLARHGGISCLVSLEMTRRECMQRFVANIAGVSTHKIDCRETPDDRECRSIVAAIAEIKQWKMSVVDKPGMKISDIEKLLAQAKAQGKPIRLIAIDHFGLIVPDNTSKGRYDQYTPISNRIKQLAKAYECTFLVLAQLNRIDDFQKPTKVNLRDTGSLEQDADKIIFLYRD